MVQMVQMVSLQMYLCMMYDKDLHIIGLLFYDGIYMQTLLDISGHIQSFVINMDLFEHFPFLRLILVQSWTKFTEFSAVIPSRQWCLGQSFDA